MNIVGINQVSGLLTGQHDGAAALVKDGKLIACAEEERFNRQRHSKGFPHLALAYCLEVGGISYQDIDIIAVGYNPWAFFTRGFFFMNFRSMVSYVAAIFIFHIQLRDFNKRHKAHARIVYVDHHLAHAASAYRCSGFADANVLTIDGAGETETAALYEGRGGKLSLKARMPIAFRFDRRPWRSIGKAYTRVTDFLNLGAHGEGKTMGLASYGTPRFDFSTILHVESFSKWTIDRRNVSGLYKQYQRADPKGPITQDQKDLAASMQEALEVAVVNLGRDAYGRNGIRNFALSGGCALNCNANSRLLAQDFCDDIFIQPASHDGGIPLGAALEVMHQVGDGDFIDFINASWGPQFSNEQIEKILKNAKVSYKKSADVADDVALHLKAGKIVSWFQGRMEMGPRALGNRSILGNPQIEGMNDKINEHVKHREVWRPFAPSCTVDAATKYFEAVDKIKESPYMLMTFYVKDQYRKVFPAITHIDGSARIQTVREDQNLPFYRLLKAMEKHTGHPMVLNTSFNDAGEPIICTPQDALRCFFATGIDVLAIGDFILEK
jgi:carbamoyltransferase